MAPCNWIILIVGGRTCFRKTPTKNVGIEPSIVGGTSYDSVDSPTDEVAEFVGDAVTEEG